MSNIYKFRECKKIRSRKQRAKRKHEAQTIMLTDRSDLKRWDCRHFDNAHPSIARGCYKGLCASRSYCAYDTHSHKERTRKEYHCVTRFT